MSTEVICELCQKTSSKYTCPKCNIPYCSVGCYKSAAHLRCSEEFYKNCIQDELNGGSPTAAGNDVRKIYEILQRIREADSGIQPSDFNEEDESDVEGPLDSDDDQTFEADDDDDCLATRLEGININDANEIWQRLNANEKEEFKTMVQSGEIMKCVPDYKPWWVAQPRQQSKIVELHSNGDKRSNDGTDNGESRCATPAIATNIPRFADICKVAPSPCVHYNIWNVMTAYACVVRHFAGEHLTSASEAVAQLVNLSATLKYGTNFEEVEDAIVSVEMEALTSNDKTGRVAPVVLVESRELLTKDAHDLMFIQMSKLAALSDILNLFQLAKREISKKQDSGTSKNAEFQKLFSLCVGSAEINRKKVKQLIKKIEFFLSFLEREDTN